MNKELKKQIKDDLDKAKASLAELTADISASRQAGFDVTALEERERELRKKITRISVAFGV
jgi:hypothetical protein